MKRNTINLNHAFVFPPGLFSKKKAFHYSISEKKKAENFIKNYRSIESEDIIWLGSTEN